MYMTTCHCLFAQQQGPALGMSSLEELSGYQKTREEWVNESNTDEDLGASIVKAIHEDANFAFYCDQLNDTQLLDALSYAMLEFIAEEERQYEPAQKAVDAGIKNILPAPRHILVLMTVEQAKKADPSSLREHLVLVGAEIVKIRENTRIIEKELDRREREDAKGRKDIKVQREERA